MKKYLMGAAAVAAMALLSQSAFAQAMPGKDVSMVLLPKFLGILPFDLAHKDAEEAAKLVNQLASLAPQLMAGMDVNGDGRITWEEGGLQIAQDHLNLMLQAEPKPKP